MVEVYTLAWALLTNMANRAPPTPAKKEGDAEGEHLVLGQVDAHGFGGDLVLPDGLEGPAVGGVDEHHDDDNAENRAMRKGKKVDRRGGGHLPLPSVRLKLLKEGI